ncbi:Splicing factor 3B subunit 6 [Mitosporidium daphniae]|uniref:RRM domain-containing protein n=1 Tax=Mitosporidium daphniae TaxID=1485682 RepID=A0A098VVD8_9MICR|nr:uncharacterized protein DI09_10p50 [Mitosporidium daphniae]KGG53108.1 hypothetical protein DI09_10p50 [Mitosporidium daphniae]|eukprot:XP_013239583.1 uncharacterized protein DI09_10p50 [Mitosporidium daphniae]
MSVCLSPEVNRILFVRNLPFKISAEDLFDLFGKYGTIRQIRIGSEKETRGTAYVVYEDIFDAKNACEHLSGFNVQGRYLIVLYYQPIKQLKKMDMEKKREQIALLRQKYAPILGSSTPSSSSTYSGDTPLRHM